MPIYEYQCKRCGKEFSFLLLNPREYEKRKCKFCGGRELTKLLSTFSVHQTEESRLAAFDSSKSKGSGFYKDSRNIGLWAKKRMREMGVDLGTKMDEIIERGRTGKILDDFTK